MTAGRLHAVLPVRDYRDGADAEPRVVVAFVCRATEAALLCDAEAQLPSTGEVRRCIDCDDDISKRSGQPLRCLRCRREWDAARSRSRKVCAG